VDIGGHPPISLAQITIFLLGNFSTVFWVPNFWVHFEALNNIFLAHLDFFNEVSSAPNEVCMPNLHPQEVDVSTNPIETHKPFGISSLRVMVFFIFSLC
jgi:hypothetical protein